MMKISAKYFVTFLAFLTCATSGATSRTSLEQIINRLTELSDYSGGATYSVLLPQAEDPVEYTLELQSTTVDGDNLSPIKYLINWDLDGNKGFSAYFDGHHYRYRNNRLQEYHYEWDSIPFTIGNGGVHAQAQFVDVLPQMMGRELARMTGDSTFIYRFTPDTIVDGRKGAVLRGKVTYHGYVSKEVTYVFDPETLMPRKVDMENNPGAISEQTVTIRFAPSVQAEFPIRNDEDLVMLYPEIFEKYRESNFKVENLAGTQLPTFSAPTSTGERYTYHRTDPLVNPTLIVILDDGASTSGATIEAVREAADRATKTFDVIIAFTTNNVDRAEELTGALRPGEHLLIGARALARDCGVTVSPTLIYVDREGTVRDTNLGYNKELSTIVIQKIALM